MHHLGIQQPPRHVVDHIRPGLYRCPLMSRTMRRGSEVKENEIPALKRQACQPNFGVFRLQKCYKLLVGPDTCPVQQTSVLILLREDAAGNNGKRLAGS